MFAWITQHGFWSAAVSYWVFSAAVSSMPAPGSSTGAVYLWVFRFLHTLAGNITTVVGSRIPGTLLGLLVMIPIVVAPAACVPHYTVHPGAVNTTDSAAYDALLIAEATIDQAKAALQAGQLPASARQPLDTLIQSYNLARASWLTYRGAITTNVSSDGYLAQLNQNITDLINAIQAFKEAL